MQMRIWWHGILLLLLLARTVPAWGATYYVGTLGSDSNSCATAQSATAADRKRTLKNAVEQCLTTGGAHTVIVGDGTYSENPITLPVGGTSATALVTIKAENARQAIIDPTLPGCTGTESACNTAWLSATDKSYVRIEGLHIRNAKMRYVIRVRNADADRATTPILGWEFVNNKFENNGNDNAGGNIGPAATIWLHAVGPAADPGAEVTSHLIEGNEFAGNYGRSVWIDQSTAVRVRRNKITNSKCSLQGSGTNCIDHSIKFGDDALWNIVEENWATGANAASVGTLGLGVIKCDTGSQNANSRNVIRRNHLYGYTQSGVMLYIEAGCDGYQIYENIVESNANAEALRFGSTQDRYPKHNVAYNNTFYNNAAGVCVRESQSNTVRNNVFVGNGVAIGITKNGNFRSALSNYTFSHNQYEGSGNLFYISPDSDGSGGQQCTGLTANKTYAEWVTASGETNSANATASFIDAAAKRFGVQNGSAAIDAGIAAGPALTYTGAGVDRGAERDPPTLVACEVGSVNATTLVSTWNTNYGAPLTSATNASLPVTVGGGAATVTGVSINGTSQVYHTLQTAVTAAQAVTLACSAYGCVKNGARIGEAMFGEARTFGAAACTNNVAGGSEQIPAVQAFAYTNGTPAVDTSRAEWANVPTRDVSSAAGSIKSGSDKWTGNSDMRGTLQVLRDADNLWLRFQATDDTTKRDSGSQWWRDDSIAVYVDGNKDSTGPWGADDVRVYVVQDGTSGAQNGACAGLQTNVTTNNASFDVELKIPRACFGNVALTAGASLGFDLEYSDDDDADAARDTLMMLSPVKHDGSTSNLIELRLESASIDLGGSPAITLSTPAVTAVASTSVTIAWTTSVNGTGNVDWDTDGAPYANRTPGDTSADNTSHSVALSGLTADTLYHFRVCSDPDGGGASPEVCSENFTVRTLPASTQPVWSQPAGRIERFHGTEAGATPITDTTLTVRPNGGLRLRLPLKVTAADPPLTNVALCMSEDQQAFTRVDEDTADAFYFPAGAVIGVADGEATTNRLTGITGTFVAGQVRVKNATVALDLGQDQYTQLVFPLRTSGNIVGKQYRFALGNSDCTALLDPNGSFVAVTGVAAQAVWQ